MKKNIEITVETLGTDDLQPVEKRLRAAAIRAAKNAYAPYSGFKVGAAALLENGEIVTGNNQENMAYPSGLCAERVALFSAGASFSEFLVEALAIAAMRDGEIMPPVAPCGACRQVMAEAERRYGRPLRVLMCGRDEIVIVVSAKDLLPLGFEL